MSDQITAALEFLRTFWNQLILYLPQIFVSLVLLIAGWLVAKLARKGVIKLLKLIRLDVAAEKTGIEDFLLNGGIRYTTVTVIANLIYWFIIFAVMLAVVNSLGLRAADDLFDRIILYIPNVAVLVLIFGALFAKFVRGATSRI